MKIFFLCCLFVLVLAPNAFSWSIFGPNSYEACVEEIVNECQNDRAAIIARGACLKKFKPEKVPTYYKIKKAPEEAADCILNKIIGAKTENAAKITYGMCLEEYPPQ